jgi:hypothetical protein
MSRQSRTGTTRSKKALAFLAAVDAVCKKHGFVISHEDGHGAFEIETVPVQAPAREWDNNWFLAARECLDD